MLAIFNFTKEKNSEREDHVEIPEYAFNVHTRKGKRMGKIKKTFFLEEGNSLFPEEEHSLFHSQLKEYIENINF